MAYQNSEVRQPRMWEVLEGLNFGGLRDHKSPAAWQASAAVSPYVRYASPFYAKTLLVLAPIDPFHRLGLALAYGDPYLAILGHYSMRLTDFVGHTRRY